MHVNAEYFKYYLGIDFEDGIGMFEILYGKAIEKQLVHRNT
jgi:hypothetical protein